MRTGSKEKAEEWEEEEEEGESQKRSPQEGEEQEEGQKREEEEPDGEEEGKPQEEISMAAIHTESAAIFGAKNVNVSEEKVIYTNYKPVNPITPNTVIEFVIPGTGDQYLSLKDTRMKLLVRFEITKEGMPYSPRKPQIPIGYKGPFQVLHNLNTRKRRSLRRAARRANGERGGRRKRKRDDNEEEEEEEEQEEEEQEKENDPKRFARDVGGGGEPVASVAAGGKPPPPPRRSGGPQPVNLTTIHDLEERRRIIRDYELQAQEWNEFVVAMDTGKDTFEAAVIPTDAIFHTMWNGIDVFMNHQLISTTNTMYPYKAYIETVLGSTASEKKYQLRNIGYTGNTMNNSMPLSKSEASPFQRPKAMNKRREMFVASLARLTDYPPAAADDTDGDDDDEEAEERSKHHYYELIGYPASDLWGIDASIVNGVEVAIKLYPNKDSFSLMTFPPGCQARLVLEDITLQVCKRKMAPKIIIGHSQVMMKQDATYPFTRTEVRSFNVGKGMRSALLENPYQSNIPTRLLFGMVRADAKAGSFNTNPLNFRHFDISRAGFYINDEPVLQRPYKVDPESGRVLELLTELYTTFTKFGQQNDIGLSKEDFLNGLFLVPFDVQPTASGNLDFLARRTGGHCRLEIDFKEPLPCNICIITYAIFPAILEIDFARNVRVVELDKPYRIAEQKGSLNKRQSAMTTAPAA